MQESRQGTKIHPNLNMEHDHDNPSCTGDPKLLDATVLKYTVRSNKHITWEATFDSAILNKLGLQTPIEIPN